MRMKGIDSGRNQMVSLRRGSINVFEDLGIANPEEALAKARLADAIADIIEQRGLTQVEAAALMGVDQPKVSLVTKGRLDGFSQDRLVRFLLALGTDVEIVLRQAGAAERGRLEVTRI
jgi:predicted XRE-type DNA-binding protein